MRDIDDAIDGHRGAGVLIENGWRLARIDGAAAGCLLLARHPLRPALELVYMGVHPAFRGRGVGRALVREALNTARRLGISAISLAVDDRNAPALKTYAEFGFRESLRRRALILPATTKADGCEG
jgi:ribosomal protein S18 acetylase RimI-like enzyme